MSRAWSLRAVVAVVFGIWVSATVTAQADRPVAGVVLDQTGAPLEGVTIRLGASGVDDRETRTDRSGRFEFRSVPPGTYSFVAEHDGFAPVQRAVLVGASAVEPLSITMAVAVLEQTIVTAAKAGAGDAHALPMAVSAVSNADLARLDTRTLEHAVALMPAVTFTQNSSFGQLSIRGIGTNAVNAGTDPSAAIYLDGVYLARPGMVFVDFLDLDRVEVVRGPQGTLYGRNAVGGALNLISRTPTNDLSLSARVTAGSFGEMRAEARASGAVKRDRIMGSVAFARGVRDGYVRDLEHADNPLGGDDLTSARAQVRVVFDRRADLLVSADVSDQDGTLLTYSKVLQVKPGFTVDNPAALHEVRASTPASSALTQTGAAVRLTSALSASTSLVSLTAYRTLDNRFVADADITELPLTITDLHERQHQWSEELTISHQRSRLSAVAGLFFFTEDDHQRVQVPQQQAGIQVLLDPRVEATSAAIFGQTTIGLTDAWSLTAGLRHTRERKAIDNFGGRYTLDATPAPVPGSIYDYTDTIAHTAWTPKFGVERKLPLGIAYVSAARGFKSGGFNLSSAQPGRGYGPESAWSYEGGVKTNLLNGRARLAISVFDMKYADLQVQTPIGIGVFDIRNAAAATIRGVELETTARVTADLSAGGHVAWLDATYDRYVAVALGGVTGDVSGNRLNNAPEWSGRAWVEWTHRIGSRRVAFAADASAQSTVYYTPFNDTIQRQRPYGLLGARIDYGPGDRRWSMGAYVRNVTDTGYIMATFATSVAAYGGRPGPSRQFGIQFSVHR